MFNKFCVIIAAIFIAVCCNDSVTESTIITKPITVNVRMEVQVLDSLHHIYSRPFTQVYFTTYILLGDGSKTDFEQSDTTSCPNGWGVKELVFTLQSEEEIIMLGAACESYDGANLRYEEITYAQAAYQADSNSVADIKRTFAIYFR